MGNSAGMSSDVHVERKRMEAIAGVLAPIFLVTAILDMMSNGSAYAEWAPWGLVLALICLAIAT